MREFADAQRIEAAAADRGSSPASRTRCGGRGGAGCPTPTRDDLVGHRAVPVPADPAPVGAARRARRAPSSRRSSRSSSPTPTVRARRTHPVKAKLASGIYHVPGGGNYDRTKPDRCYVDADAAEADGLRAAKR